MRTGESVQGQEAERGRTVDQHEVVVLGHLGEGIALDRLVGDDVPDERGRGPGVDELDDDARPRQPDPRAAPLVPRAQTTP